MKEEINKIKEFIITRKKFLIKAFSYPIIIFIINAIMISLGIYNNKEWLDMPMHFIGGVSVGITYTLILSQSQKDKLFTEMNKIIFFIFATSLVISTELAWEFLEYIADYSGLFAGITQFQTTINDIIMDFFLGTIGGIVGYFITFRKLSSIERY